MLYKHTYIFNVLPDFQLTFEFHFHSLQVSQEDLDREMKVEILEFCLGYIGYIGPRLFRVYK